MQSARLPINLPTVTQTRHWEAKAAEGWRGAKSGEFPADAKLGHNGDRTNGSPCELVPAPAGKKVLPVGDWDQARIVSKGKHGGFWLNGVKTVEFERCCGA